MTSLCRPFQPEHIHQNKQTDKHTNIQRDAHKQTKKSIFARRREVWESPRRGGQCSHIRTHTYAHPPIACLSLWSFFCFPPYPVRDRPQSIGIVLSMSLFMRCSNKKTKKEMNSNSNVCLAYVASVISLFVRYYLSIEVQATTVVGCLFFDCQRSIGDAHSGRTSRFLREGKLSHWSC